MNRISFEVRDPVVRDYCRIDVFVDGAYSGHVVMAPQDALVFLTAQLIADEAMAKGGFRHYPQETEDSLLTAHLKGLDKEEGGGGP